MKNIILFLLIIGLLNAEYVELEKPNVYTVMERLGIESDYIGSALDTSVAMSKEINEIEFNILSLSKNTLTKKLLIDSLELFKIYSENKLQHLEYTSQGFSRAVDMNCQFRYEMINYMMMIMKINEGFIPKIRKDIENALSHTNNKKLYNSWVAYRDATAKLFANISTEKSEQFWKNWIEQSAFKEYAEYAC